MLDTRILDAFSKISRRLSSYEFSVMLVLITHSDQWFSNSSLVSITGIHMQHISRVKALLFESNMTLKQGAEISIQPDTSLWRVRARRGRDKGKIQELNT